MKDHNTIYLSKNILTFQIKHYISSFLIILTLLPVVISCRKNDEAYILSYNINNQQAEVEIDQMENSIIISFSENISDADNLVAEFLLSEGASMTADNTLQESGQSVNNYEHPFSYKVESEDGSSLIEWKVTSTNNSYCRQWGLGGFQKTSKSNNRNYVWYIDQYNTGPYYSDNCGPASTTMAAKWSNALFLKSTQDARATYRPDGGWWYTPDIYNYLTKYSIPHYYVDLSTTVATTQDLITGKLDSNNIIILCLDMWYICYSTDDKQKVDRFYPITEDGWGHFIVVKGYKKVDDQVFFEVYDPYSFDNKYPDGTLKGKDRFYRSKDIFTAASNWWNYGIVVSSSDTKNIKETGLDPIMVPEMWGR